jgi:hypothetical protein
VPEHIGHSFEGRSLIAVAAVWCLFRVRNRRHTCATRLGDRGASAFEIAQIMGWSDIRMAMRYTHATGDGIRRAMQLLTQSGVGNRKVVQLQNWTDTKVPTLNGNGQHALPVSA